MANDFFVIESQYIIQDADSSKERIWFNSIVENKQITDWIFSRHCLNKLKELSNNYNEWVKWLYQENNKNEAECKDIIEKELSKEISLTQNKGVDKWRFKVKFFSNTHIINQKVLNIWNKDVVKIKFNTAKEKNEIVCQFILTDSIHLTNLEFSGFNFTKILLFSINIATFGHFWFYNIKFESMNYEEIYDIEHDKRINFEIIKQPTDVLPNDVLDEVDIRNIKIVYVYLGNSFTKLDHILREYYLALVFLAKNDVFLGFYNLVMIHLLNAMELALKYFYKDSTKANIEEFIKIQYSDNQKFVDEISRIISLAQSIRLNKLLNDEIILHDILKLKTVFDNLIITKAREHIDILRKAKNNTDF